MKQSERIRGTKRLVVLLKNIQKYGVLTCMFCNTKIIFESPHVDHYIARNAGGDAKDLHNCIVACASCNSRKQDRNPRLLFGDKTADMIEDFLASIEYDEKSYEMARKVNKLKMSMGVKVEMLHIVALHTEK